MFYLLKFDVELELKHQCSPVANRVYCWTLGRKRVKVVVFYPLGSKGIKCGGCADKLYTVCLIETMETTTILRAWNLKQISIGHKQPDKSKRTNPNGQSSTLHFRGPKVSSYKLNTVSRCYCSTRYNIIVNEKNGILYWALFQLAVFNTGNNKC
jgi:hypothetical protein